MRNQSDVEKGFQNSRFYFGRIHLVLHDHKFLVRLMQITNLDSKIEEAIYYLEVAIDRIETQSDNFEIFPREVKLGDIPPDYEKNVFELNELVQNLRIIQRQNRLLRIDDATKTTMLSQFQNNEDPKPIIITEIYTVSELDTLEGIGIKLKVDWKKVAEYNNLDSMDLTAGDELAIPREIDPRIIFQYQEQDTPVFDLPSGENILGKDLPNTLEEDTDGDLKVLNARETFVQGMENIMSTDYGSLPFYPGWGLEHWVGDDVPADVQGDWKKEMLRRSFLRDSRVFEVPLEEIEITSLNDFMYVTMNIYPIQGLNYERLEAQTRFVVTPTPESIPDSWDYSDDIDA